MQQHPNDKSTVVTTGGTFCVFDDNGQLLGTITRPVERHPLGAGREKVYLARPAEQECPPRAKRAQHAA